MWLTSMIKLLQERRCALTIQSVCPVLVETILTYASPCFLWCHKLSRMGLWIGILPFQLVQYFITSFDLTINHMKLILICILSEIIADMIECSNRRRLMITKLLLSYISLIFNVNGATLHKWRYSLKALMLADAILVLGLVATISELNNMYIH